MKTLEAQFQDAMYDLYKRADRELHYRAARFLRMLTEHGGVETARRLINTANPSDGFTYLWRHQRLDLATEAEVLKPQWASLFTPEERAHCRKRLTDYGFNPDSIALSES